VKNKIKIIKRKFAKQGGTMGVNRKQRHLEFPFWREYWLKFNFNYFSWTKDQNLFCRELFSWGWTEKFNKRL